MEATWRSFTTPMRIGLALIFVYVTVAFWASDHGAQVVGGSLLLAPALALLALLLVQHTTRHWPDLALIVLVAVVARMAAPLVFRTIVDLVYEGTADAFVYAGLAENLQPVLRSGSFEIGPEQLGGFSLLGTGVIIVATSLLYILIGASDIAAFYAFAFAGLLGLYLLVRAFAESCPDGDRRWYAAVVLLLPSMVFWTAAIGKESWMLLGIGLASLGVARIVNLGRGGAIMLIAGLLIQGLVRPHVAVICALAGAMAVIRSRGLTTGRRRASVMATVLPLVAATGALLLAGSYFGLDLTKASEIDAFLEDTSQRTTFSGSAFEPVRVSNPVELPEGFVTVLLRPFPHEADGPLVLMASLEGFVLLGLAVHHRRRLKTLLVTMWRNAYVLYAGLFTTMFVIAFSYFSNFGLLARQRVQVLPIAAVLILASSGRTQDRGEPADS